MAAIPLPERGQPLDVNYIYDIVSQINSITNTIAVRSTSTSRINSNSDTTSNLKFYAETKTLSTTNASGNDTESFFFNYPEFKFPPVITITILNNTGSSAGDNVLATLRNVGTSRCEGVVRFNVSGAVNLSISMIAIGIAP
jgi:hypothetical protein